MLAEVSASEKFSELLTSDWGVIALLLKEMTFLLSGWLLNVGQFHQLVFAPPKKHFHFFFKLQVMNSIIVAKNCVSRSKGRRCPPTCVFCLCCLLSRFLGTSIELLHFLLFSWHACIACVGSSGPESHWLIVVFWDGLSENLNHLVASRSGSKVADQIYKIL